MWGERPAADVEVEIFETFADRVAETSVCVEISTAGLHRPVAELYPDPRLLSACHARDVPITLASDAHTAGRVGENLERAVALARDAGYDSLTGFQQREPPQVPLG